MHLEFILEEPSAEKVINNLLPKIITGEHTYKCIVYQGKKDLLKNLPNRLKGYARWINTDFKIIVLIDRDNDDCRVLKESLNQFAVQSGLKIKSSSANNSFNVMNRIAIEEIESWFFGDPEAIRTAYPKIASQFENKSSYRAPDNITNTWETLESLLQGKGYFKTGLRKIEAANEISKYMNPLQNRSESFQTFWDGISTCLGT